MKICGIIAEYNPFHNGHAYHCQQTRSQLGADTGIVAVMSGNFVQRGDFALLDKYQRAEMAVQNSVDLVVELPLPAALSSAQNFAYGAVKTLVQMHCITHLSFGSECGDISQIQRAAQLNRTELSLSHSLPYAAALQQALSAIDPAAASLLNHPNNILGIEYCAALHMLNSTIQPITVTRSGAAHDSTTFHSRPSASFVRQQVLQSQNCDILMPHSAWNILSRALCNKTAPVHIENCEHAILCHLRRLSADELHRFCGGADGLQNRLYQAIQHHYCFSDICDAAQTRRYPRARIRRALLRAYLNLPLCIDCSPKYLRILAIGPRGRMILRKMQSPLPVITKPVAEKFLPAQLHPLLKQDILADDLFAMAQPAITTHIGGSHYRKTPFCCK